MTPTGPLLVLIADTAVRGAAWLAYGPLRESPRPETPAPGAERRGRMSLEVLAPSAEGRGRMSLEALALLLSQELGLRVETVDPDAAAVARVDDVQSVLRNLIPEALRAAPRLDPETQVRFFYDFAHSLKRDLLSGDTARRREAILAAEFFYFGKPCEQLVNLHAPLLKPDPTAWSAFLGEGGGADARAKEMVRYLATLEIERPRQGLPTFMRPRFAKLMDSVAHVTPCRH